MTNFSHGRTAEEAASLYLIKHGYKVLEQNWRTKYCEIDLVAQKDKTIYFVEVKYRKNDLQGEGLDYITDKKLKQMTFAARVWVQQDGWAGDYSLSALEVSGPDYEVTEFIPELD